MGRLTATRKLIVEDFPDQKDWIGNLFVIVNDFFTKSVSVLNGNIEFGQNIIGIERELDFVYVSDAASLPQKIRWELNVRPRAFYMVSALEGEPKIANSFRPVTLCANYILNEKNEVEINGLVKLQSSGVSSLVPQKRYKILIRITP